MAPGKHDNSWLANAFGVSGHNRSDNEHEGDHHTVYNDVWSASWDEDAKGDYVEGSYHEHDLSDEN